MSFSVPSQPPLPRVMILRGGGNASHTSFASSQMILPRSLALRQLRERCERHETGNIERKSFYGSGKAEEIGNSGAVPDSVSEAIAPTEEDFLEWAKEAEQAEARSVEECRGGGEA